MILKHFLLFLNLTLYIVVRKLIERGPIFLQIPLFISFSCTKGYERKLLMEMNEIEINCMRNIGMSRIYFGTQIDVASQFALN